MGHAIESDWKKGSTYAWEDHGLKIEHPEQVILESDPYRRLAFTFHTFIPELATAVEQLDEDIVANWRPSTAQRCPSTSSRTANRSS